jgi:hypothetical protein
MRFKAAGFIFLVTVLVLILGFIWQIEEINRVSADVIQFGKQNTIQPNSVQTESLSLFLTDNQEQLKLNQEAIYTISYTAKKNIKNVRIVGVLGETKKNVSPTFSWNLGDIKAGSSATFNVPVKIESNESGLAVSRVTVSEIIKPRWWAKERREVLATVDDIDQIIPQ